MKLRLAGLAVLLALGTFPAFACSGAADVTASSATTATPVQTAAIVSPAR